ncbi:MAG: methyl-accepting chemotaxis sensory transducer [Gemmatimonadetes bacterium]|nr:methyl-accepting chemotaxis sensory transducer [Gemmatimonadota bacterium]
MSRPVALRALAYPVIAAGAALFAWFQLRPVPTTGPVLLAALLFGAAAVALATIEISLGGKISLSPEISAVLLAALLYGPGAAAIAVTMSSVSVCVRRKRSLLRTLYTPAQFVLSLAVFTAIYSGVNGAQFGARAAERALDGGPGGMLRYALAVLLGTAAYVLVNDGFVLSYIGLDVGRGDLDVKMVLLGDTGGSVVLLLLGTLVAFGVGAFGTATLLFAVPIVGAVWGVVTFARARLTAGELSVSTRLTAFFSASVGIVFLVLSAVLLGSFVGRYTDALGARQEAYGRGVTVALEDALRRGERLETSAVSKEAVDRLVERDPDVAYALLVPGAESGRAVASRFGPRAAPVAERIAADLAASPDAADRRWELPGGDLLRVREVHLPVLGPGGARAGELRLGLDLATARREVSRLAFVLGLSTLVLFAALLALLRRYAHKGLVGPLDRVGAAIANIAEGDADLSARLPVEGDREIAGLGTHFNRFVDRLVELVSTTARATGEVAGGAGEVAASCQELSASAGSVADSMSDAVHRLDRERDEAEALHGLTRQLAELNARVGEQMADVARETDDVVRLAERNQEGIARAGDALLEVREVVRESVAASTELIDAARRIQGIVGSIRQIADQTNLLSLNAAIEAARAGEHGRGFAVVAEEVRKLADGSAGAAREANELIGVLTGRIDRVVRAMKKGGDRAEGVERISAESREALGSILEVIGRIARQIQEVSGAVVQERGMVGQVDRQVSVIERLVGENAAMVSQVGAATEQQTASIDQMTALSQHMVAEVDALQGLIARFRLPDGTAPAAGADGVIPLHDPLRFHAPERAAG